jgi:hypothetical protein
LTRESFGGPAGRLTRDDVVVAVVARRIARLLQRRGLAAAEESRAPDAWSEDAPVLAGIAAASVEGRIARGPRAGARVQRYGEPPDDLEPAMLGPCHAQTGGMTVRETSRRSLWWRCLSGLRG